MYTMAAASKTRNVFEGMVREGSFKWLLGRRNSFYEELEEMEKSGQKNFIPELSSIANVIVRRCSKILGVSSSELQDSFNDEASDYIKHPSRYARSFFEYCCLRALALSTQVKGYLADKKFRRLTFDMMVAWEVPAVDSQPLLSLDEVPSVGLEAFARLAPAVPVIANVIISENLFEVLTASAGGRLNFFIYDKYLNGLERAIKKMKSQTESSLLFAFRSSRGEKILEFDGTVTTQPVLEHIGISAWPGRLILTDHALYFEPHRVVSYDKPKRYDLADDLKQVVKPELTGPWGTRLFDTAVLYKSTSLSEPFVIEFPELKGHTRRDYWLAITREILYAHRFISKYSITGVEKDEAVSMAVLGILRMQAIQDMSLLSSGCFESLLMFNLCDRLPGGDLILETLANMSISRALDRSNKSEPGGETYSISALGFIFGSTTSNPCETALIVGEVAVGEMSLLEKAVKESRDNFQKVMEAQGTVEEVKLDGIDTKVAVMEELLVPLMEVGNSLLSLLYWDNLRNSSIFCLLFTFIICRGWLRYAFSLTLLFLAAFMVLTRCFNQGRHVYEIKVVAPPPLNTVEQLLALQNAISKAEQHIQEGNIALLKIHGLLNSIFPQASEKFAIGLCCLALIMVFLPSKYIILLVFLELFTRYSPLRKVSTERWMRRLREWWVSIPAAPVYIEREKDYKKRK